MGTRLRKRNHRCLLTETSHVSVTSKSHTALHQVLCRPRYGEAITDIASDTAIVKCHINSAISVITDISERDENHVFFQSRWPREKGNGFGKLLDLSYRIYAAVWSNY